MTTAYESDVLELPEPIGLQPQWLNSTAARKVLRIGRRGSKTRFAMIASIAGHGPGAPEEPMFGGILHGGDVLWVAVDYPQLTTVMWREELVPRFAHLPWATLNANEHTLTIPGKGTLFLRSAEALRGVRGMGKNLKGIIIDEAAHFDLEGALLNEVLPTLLDNNGWLVIMSTTNAGPDGNSDKRVPSYFNMICEAIRSGDPRFTGWEEFHGTAFDNPVIDDANIHELIGLYPEGSPALKQEVYAELLKGGIGLALEQVDKDRHLVPAFKVPADWMQFGAFDWGFNHPYAFGWLAVDPDGDVVLIDTVWGRQEQPDQIAAKVEAAVPVKQLNYIVGGTDLKNDVKSRGETGPTLKERFSKRGWKLIDAKVSRVSGLNNLRLYVEWKATDHTPERRPRFTMMDTEGNRRVLAQLQAMQIDEKNIEDAAKVDADYAGRGGDDGYDMLRYALMSRPIAPQGRPAVTFKQEDRATPYDYTHKRLAPKPDARRDLLQEPERRTPGYRMPRMGR